MAAFQDFGNYTERRNAERQRKLRKRLTIAGIVSVIVVLLIVAGVLVTTSPKKIDGKPQEITAGHDSKELSTSFKAVKTICHGTDYKESCVSSLSKALGPNGNPEPKELLKAAVQVVLHEVGKAFNHSSKFVVGNDTAGNPRENAAIADCRELLEDAMDELRATLSDVDEHDVKNLPKRAADLKNWLSAVISYQHTCLDGIPQGETKAKMEKGLKTATELTSNALAIVSSASSLLSSLVPGFNRRLLAEDGYPTWVSIKDRRVLRVHLKKIKPNVVVSKDGSGNYKTINDALAGIPKKYKGRYVIYVKEGVYDETVIVTKEMVNITIYGDGSRKTIVTGNKNYVDGVQTFRTATFAAIGDGFIARAIGFRNTAGAAKHQAVALRVQSDRSIFVNCRMDGYQDTLYAQTHRQFYRNCAISGTIDFIFGDAAAVFQKCQLIVRMPLPNQINAVTAHGRTDKRETTGIVIHNCKILPDKKLVTQRFKIKSYLGRPWKQYARTIVMETTIGDFIQPEGWYPWDGDFGLKTLVYGEYMNKGPGASVAKRVAWPGYKVINKKEAMKYTVGAFIQGGDWVKASDTPVQLGLFR